jgi:hypothetical protein
LIICDNATWEGKSSNGVFQVQHVAQHIYR